MSKYSFVSELSLKHCPEKGRCVGQSRVKWAVQRHAVYYQRWCCSSHGLCSLFLGNAQGRTESCCVCVHSVFDQAEMCVFVHCKTYQKQSCCVSYCALLKGDCRMSLKPCWQQHTAGSHAHTHSLPHTQKHTRSLISTVSLWLCFSCNHQRHRTAGGRDIIQMFDVRH